MLSKKLFSPKKLFWGAQRSPKNLFHVSRASQKRLLLYDFYKTGDLILLSKKLFSAKNLFSFLSLEIYGGRNVAPKMNFMFLGCLKKYFYMISIKRVTSFCCKKNIFSANKLFWFLSLDPYGGRNVAKRIYFTFLGCLKKKISFI